MSVAEWADTYGIHHSTDRFFEVAIESWPEWDLNPRPLYTSNESIELVYKSKHIYVLSWNELILV